MEKIKIFKIKDLKENEEVVKLLNLGKYEIPKCYKLNSIFLKNGAVDFDEIELEWYEDLEKCYKVFKNITNKDIKKEIKASELITFKLKGPGVYYISQVIGSNEKTRQDEKERGIYIYQAGEDYLKKITTREELLNLKNLFKGFSIRELDE